jgi:3-oxoisoapionate-4-phosphate decarboxylase
VAVRRLVGAKYWEPDESFVQSFNDLAQPIFADNDRPLPVVCFGQWGGQAPETWRRTGKTLDLIYLCGGGVVAHPAGPASGVLAVQHAWQTAVAGVSLEDYAMDHSELGQSLVKFGGAAVKVTEGVTAFRSRNAGHRDRAQRGELESN